MSTAFGVDGDELTRIRDADPVSLFDCLACGDPLSERGRRHLLRLLRASKLVCATEAGELVEDKILSVLLRDGCAQGVCHPQREQVRAFRGMPRPEYLKTDAWEARRKLCAG
jgi:hypothetical protein